MSEEDLSQSNVGDLVNSVNEKPIKNTVREEPKSKYIPFIPNEPLIEERKKYSSLLAAERCIDLPNGGFKVVGLVYHNKPKVYRAGTIKLEEIKWKRS